VIPQDGGNEDSGAALPAFGVGAALRPEAGAGASSDVSGVAVGVAGWTGAVSLHTATPFASKLMPLITECASAFSGHRTSVSFPSGENPEPVIW
jgi:hypothetical protein